MQRAFSHSSLETYERCPRKYYYRYVERVPIETESIEAFLGKQVHEVLERLYRFTAEGLVPSLRRVIDRFHANWEERFDPERVEIVRSGTDADFYRGNGVRCLENYYRSHYPFDEDETLGLERPIRFRLDEAGAYRIRGVIDRVARAPDGTLEVHDFKTSARVPPQSVLDTSRQLALYELGLRERDGERGPVRLVWHYLLPGTVRRSSRSPEALEALREETARTIDRIRAEEEWAPQPSRLCDWCEFRTLCPAYAEARAAEAAAAEGPPAWAEPPHPAETAEPPAAPPEAASAPEPAAADAREAAAEPAPEAARDERDAPDAPDARERSAPRSPAPAAPTAPPANARRSDGQLRLL